MLSNHVHLLVTDPDARLPEFEQYLDSLVARALNASLARWESFWAGSSSYSAVMLASPLTILDRMAYVLANPVAAGLVRRGKDWPGLWSGVEAIGGPPITQSSRSVWVSSPAGEITPGRGFGLRGFYSEVS